jgi:dienelactone hydrolase
MKKVLIFWFLFLVFWGTKAPGVLAQTRMDSAGIPSMRSIPFLPEPLVLDEGGKNIAVVTFAQWKQKKSWIRDEYQYWISGAVPPAPGNMQVKVLHEKVEDGITLRTVELSFGPGRKAKMTVELMIPKSGKPMPVFLTQWNHRGWAQVAVRRGYIGCLYAGADLKDDSENYSAIYAGYDFATLMKRAWGASRVVDYLHKLPEVDTSAIGLTGHSRNGKQSLMAAAFDERIKAVISSCGGTGGESSFRWSDNRFTPGSFDRMVKSKPDWFSNRLPWFIGQENKLPVDQNSLMSLIAPRGLMLVSAITEDEGNPWGVEQSYQSVKKIYSFLHADNKIAINLRPGRHQHAARDAEGFVDFFDYIFGFSKRPPENKLYYNYSFENWKRISKAKINPANYPIKSTTQAERFPNKNTFNQDQDSIRTKISWLLGDEPPGVHDKIPFSPLLKKNKTYPNDYLDEVIGEAGISANIKRMTIGPYIPLGDDLWANIYFPDGSVTNDSVSKKLPLLIYLHEHAYATGYHRKSMAAIRQFTDQGFAVLAFDMVGFGTRIEEAALFYERYPDWSLMGKMVTDTRNAITDACNRMPFIDSQKIYLAGNALGGTVALFTAALDKRVKGLAAVNAFSSFRTDNTGTEGVKHYSHLHGLLPRLGFFIGQENRIPVDFDEIMACIAPRPLLLVASTRDRNHTEAKVNTIVNALSDVYKEQQASGNLLFEQPRTYNHFPDSLQKSVASWLLKQEPAK